ncbi:MAG: Sll0314/Alr1548 family TPR repeat-containing protein [Jaaginema sp. PMC 1080.18]|nr:Sll0314/Alr1548 family TPR repeat-containing protein [Jaaginema sp. PMC 1080.18]MEC4866385.1 Sll0314/Alr1548 family TPR repeat-containing protein [Jaaginema sp. PMC 1078.18]
MSNIRLNPRKAITLALSMTVAVTANLWGLAAWAGDPFRNSNTRDIGDRTEAAIEAIFVEGDYTKGQGLVTEAIAANPNEPLTHAIAAALAYSNEDWEALRPHARATLDAAEKLLDSDPLRGNIYMAVGNFIEGSYTIKTQGPIGAVSKLQKVLQYISEAEKIDADDPELSLLKGYMELMLAVNLPFANPENAIANFRDNAAPTYMVNRGIAIAYRDLEKYDQALTYVEKALQETPDNPEVHYLQAQILYKLGKQRNDAALVEQAAELFESVIARQDQLPDYLDTPLQFELQLARNWLQENS